MNSATGVFFNCPVPVTTLILLCYLPDESVQNWAYRTYR